MVALVEEFKEKLADYDDRYQRIPGAYHPTLQMAVDLTSGDGQAFDTQKLEETLAVYREQAVFGRAEYHAEYIGDADVERNKAKLKKALREVAARCNGDISKYVRRCHHLYGQVLTGHPTYSMHPEMSRALSRLFTERAKGTEDLSQYEGALRDSLALEFKPPTLDDEEEQAHFAIDNIQIATGWAEEAAIEVAQEEFAYTWTAINYAPVTVATWIPFDWDGRADIEWSQVIEKFIHLTRMLDDIKARLENIRRGLEGSDQRTIADLITQVEETKARLQDHRSALQDYNSEDDPDLRRLAGINRAMMEDIADRITDSAVLIEPLQEIINEVSEPDILYQLVHLRSRLHNHGLKIADPHIRVNSKSVMSAAAERDKGVIPSSNGSTSSFHLGNVARWNPTIMQQMGVAAKLRQYIDAHGKIRYLIAECDDVKNVLEALQFAKDLGIDDKLDISPLFEDRKGLDNARAIAKKLFKDPDYIAHVKKTGMVPFQFGYSDSGRYDGQSAASRFIERVQEMVLIEFSDACKRDSDLRELELCFFSTGGNNPGRGEHPVSVAKRARYFHTPRILARAQKLGLKVKYEATAQGGDGNLLFGTPEAAFAQLTETLCHLLKYHPVDVQFDPFYGKLSGAALEFFTDARDAHDALAHGQANADLLATFVGFLFQTGSRPVRRDISSGGQRELPRAIPDNAAKKQLGLMYNMTHGLGTAIQENPERYRRLMGESPIFRETMEAVDYVLERSDPEILRSYIDLYNPEFWQTRARHMKSGSREQQRCLDVARKLEQDGFYARFSPVALKVCEDFEQLKEARLDLNIPDDPMKTPKRQAAMARKQMNLRALHGMRMASIIDLFEHAMDIPEFPTARHDVTRDDIITKLMNFDSTAIDDLNVIFASGGAEIDSDLDFGEESTWPSGTGDYSNVATNVIQPMEQDLEFVCTVSETVMHEIPGVG